MGIREAIGKMKAKLFGKKEPKKDAPKQYSVTEQYDTIMEETRERLSQEATRELKELLEKTGEAPELIQDIKPPVYNAAESGKWEYRFEKWKAPKKPREQMTNNERKRRGIPMIRRRAYIQIEKNKRKKARKK